MLLSSVINLNKAVPELLVVPLKNIFTDHRFSFSSSLSNIIEKCLQLWQKDMSNVDQRNMQVLYFLSHWYGRGYHNRKELALRVIENYFIYFSVTIQSQCFSDIFHINQRISVLIVYDKGLRQQGSNYYNKVTPDSAGL